MNIKNKIIIPFTDIWVKDCYHMSLLPAVIYVKGNADCILFNQYFKYMIKDGAITFFSSDYQNVYAILKSNGIPTKPIEKVENICAFIDEELCKGNVVVVGIDNYYESIRKDCYYKKHSGHSILIYGVNHHEKKYLIIEQPFFYSLEYDYYEISFEELNAAYTSFLKRKNDVTFFYNDLTATTRINKIIPSVCAITTKSYDFNLININVRNQYRHSIIQHKDEINESLEIILKYKEIALNIYDCCNQENDESLFFIRKLSELINNKVLEQYLYTLLEPNQINNQDLLKQTIQKWNEVRMMLSKHIFSGNKNEKHINKFEKNLIQIYKQEKLFYSNTLK